MNNSIQQTTPALIATNLIRNAIASDRWYYSKIKWAYEVVCAIRK